MLRNSPIVQIYKDGFRIGNMTVRLSNIKPNLKSVSGVIAGTACTLFGGARAENKIYFQDQSGSYYLLEVFGNQFDRGIQDAENNCDMNLNITAASLPANFNKLMGWCTSQVCDYQGDIISFSRAAGNPPNQTLEQCVNGSITNIQSQFIKSQSNLLVGIFVPLFGLIAIVITIMIIASLKGNCEYKQPSIRDRIEPKRPAPTDESEENNTENDSTDTSVELGAVEHNRNNAQNAPESDAPDNPTCMQAGNETRQDAENNEESSSENRRRASV